MTAKANGLRFEFGENWSRYLRHLTPERIQDAEQSLRQMLGVDSLAGRRLLDAGCGSGLFSLAARRLGATVHSFDYDPDSVACTQQLRNHYSPDDPDWVIEPGSVLDREYLGKLGQFDVVYSWGVLHHTGNMWAALENIIGAVKPSGKLFVSLYNDQGWISSYWTAIKAAYNRWRFLRGPIIAFHAPYLVFARWVAQVLKRTRRQHRGMTLRYDMLDWLGGYPFEVATPERVVAYYEGHGFKSDQTKRCGRRHGCNEFVFTRVSGTSADAR